MDSRTGKLLWFGFSTAIILAMIYLADIGRFVEALTTARPLPLIPALFFGLSVFLVWAYTWHHFLHRIGVKIPYRESVSMFMAGHFFNSITPLGQFGGEPLMAMIISRNTSASYAESLSTVLSADIMNAVPGFTFIIGGGIYLALLGSMEDIILQTVYAALVLAVLGGLLVYNLWFKAGKIEGAIIRALRKVSSSLGRGESLVERAEKGLERMQESFERVGENPRDLLKVGSIAHLGFLLQLFCLYLILLAVGHPSSLAPLYFVLTISFFGAFSPTPGGTGTFEALMAGTLNIITGMPFPAAIAAAILFRLTTYWPGIVIGYISVNMMEYSRE